MPDLHKMAFVDCTPAGVEPFSGPGGRVFDVMLRRANISRDECFLSGAGADPDKLARQLELVQPNVIVPVGAEALNAFTGTDKIGRFRGSVIAATYIRHGAKLLPTMHPDQVMKQWKMLPVVVGDIIKAAREADKGPEIIYPTIDLWIQPTIEETEDFLSRCYQSELLSVDIETGWGMITCIGFAPNEQEAICVPFVDLSKPNKSYWVDRAHEVRTWRAIRDLMASPVPKLGQNFTYDAFWLHEYGIEVRNYLHDTRLIHHAMYPELPKDLASMAGSYTDLPQWKSWGAHGEEKRDA